MKLEADGQSKAEQIRENWRLWGAMPIRQFVHRMRDEGIFDEQDREAAEIRGLCADTRKALKENDEHGVPFAGPIEKGRNPIWRQTEMWALEDFVFALSEGISALNADYAKLKTLQDLCRERFGTAPSLPDFV